MPEQRVRPPWWLKYVNKVMIGLNPDEFDALARRLAVFRCDPVTV